MAFSFHFTNYYFPFSFFLFISDIFTCMGGTSSKLKPDTYSTFKCSLTDSDLNNNFETVCRDKYTKYLLDTTNTVMNPDHVVNHIIPLSMALAVLTYVWCHQDDFPSVVQDGKFTESDLSAIKKVLEHHSNLQSMPKQEDQDFTKCDDTLINFSGVTLTVIMGSEKYPAKTPATITLVGESANRFKQQKSFVDSNNPGFPDFFKYGFTSLFDRVRMQ